MPQATSLEIQTAQRQELVDVTAKVKAAVRAAGVESGLCVVYCPHTTAGITVNENTDPAVRADVLAAYRRLVPRDQGFTHDEGNSDAHTMSVLTGVQQTFIVENGKLLLGHWQAIYFAEFDGPRKRTVHVKVVAG
jgi:secondary thiamine-phosphate synthase enzyme